MQKPIEGLSALNAVALNEGAIVCSELLFSRV